MTRVSVVVPTYDREAEVTVLLSALEGQTRPPDEVIIVAAGGGPAGWVSSRFHVTVLTEEPNVCRQRNVGAAKASGDLIFFLDDDVRPAADFIARMTGTLERRPEYAGGMGTLRPQTRRWSAGALLCRVFMLQHEYGDGRWYPSGMPRHPYGTSEFRDTEVLGGGLMALRRDVFTRDGAAFDEEMPHSLEDAEFAWRLSRTRRLFFDPESRVTHEASPKGRPHAREAARRYMAAYRRIVNKGATSWNLAAHLWALSGMFLMAAASGAADAILGYASALASEEPKD